MPDLEYVCVVFPDSCTGTRIVLWIIVFPEEICYHDSTSRADARFIPETARRAVELLHVISERRSDEFEERRRTTGKRESDVHTSGVPRNHIALTVEPQAPALRRTRRLRLSCSLKLPVRQIHHEVHLTAA